MDLQLRDQYGLLHEVIREDREELRHAKRNLQSVNVVTLTVPLAVSAFLLGMEERHAAWVKAFLILADFLFLSLLLWVALGLLKDIRFLRHWLTARQERFIKLDQEQSPFNPYLDVESEAEALDDHDSRMLVAVAATIMVVKLLFVLAFTFFSNGV